MGANHTVIGKVVGPGETLFKCQHCLYDVLLVSRNNGPAVVYVAHPGKLDCQHTGQVNGIIFPLPEAQTPAGELTWLTEEDSIFINSALAALDLPYTFGLNPADLAWLEQTLTKLED